LSFGFGVFELCPLHPVASAGSKVYRARPTGAQADFVQGKLDNLHPMVTSHVSPLT